MISKTLPLTALLVFVIFAGQSHAYLDLGTGSYILQILLAGFLATGFAFKSFWAGLFQKIKGTFKSESDQTHTENPNDHQG